MREIRFRGKTIGGEWVYGLLSQSFAKHGQPKEKGFYISNRAGMPWAYHVRPETISLFTGLIAIDGEEAYYGDIIKFYDTEGVEYVHKILWSEELHCTMIGTIPYQKLFESGFIQPSKLLFTIIGNQFETNT